MRLFEWLNVLLVAGVALAALARRFRLPYPTFLALGGAGLAVLPVGPSFALDPQLALALFVAPILLDEAYDASIRDMRLYWLPISFLVVAAVLLTTVAVAFVARTLQPDLTWAAALTLGAIVAPPDATAASAVLGQVSLPYRVRTILAGESLFNDASALFVYRLALTATTAGAFSFSSLAVDFTLVVPLSLAAGWLLSRVARIVIALIDDAPSSIIAQFVMTFGIWVVAERLHLSAVLTIVSFAVFVSHTPTRGFGARLRLPAFAVWETATFLLNVLAFILVGLQLRPILEAMPEERLIQSLLFATAVLATCMVTRMVWVFGFYAIQRRLIDRNGWPHEAGRPNARSGLVVAWCGMRGIVTLAAAFALPVGGDGQPAFPHRELVLLTAFVVVFGTLVLQGMTLRPLLGWAKLRDDGLLRREIGRARTAVYRAALDELGDQASPAVDALRSEYKFILEEAEQHPEGFAPAKTEQDEHRLRTIGAARAKLRALRDTGEIGSGAFSRIEAELDQAEMHAND